MANIEKLFNTFRTSGKESDKIELLSAITEGNKIAKLAFCAKVIDEKENGIFSGYVNSERQYIGSKLEKDDAGNYVLSNNSPIHITLWDYSREKLSASAFDDMKRKFSPVVKLANDFLKAITDNVDSNTVSIKDLKNGLTEAFHNVGFSGYVTSKHVRVYFIDVAKAKKTSCDIKSISLRNIFDIFEKIDADMVRTAVKNNANTL